MDTKRKMNRNESYREKNRGPAYMPRFVTFKPSVLRYQSELSKTIVNNFSSIKK